jgi:hypothetical protein
MHKFLFEVGRVLRDDSRERERERGREKRKRGY